MDVNAVETTVKETRTFFRHAMGELLRVNAPDNAIYLFMEALRAVGCAQSQLSNQDHESQPMPLTLLEARPLSLHMALTDRIDINPIEKIITATCAFLRRAIAELLIADAPDSHISLFVEALRSIGYAQASLSEQDREDPITALAVLEQRLLSLQQSVELVLQKVEAPKESQYLD